MELVMNEIKVSRQIAGRTLTLSTGLMAKQAAGAVVVQYGDTVLLSAVAMGEPRFADSDFFPLMVDYREKTYAAGKFPGGFFKREKAPTTKETLTMRLADRPIRPLFPKDFRKEVIIQSMVLSADMVNEPDIMSIIGAAAACSLSNLPFDGPAAAVRIGMKDGNLIVNPTIAEMDAGELNLVVAGTHESIVMVEAGADEIPEDKMVEALELAHNTIREIVDLVNELVDKAGRKEKMEVEPLPLPTSLDAVRAAVTERMKVAVCTEGKFGRRDAVKALNAEIIEQMAKSEEEGGPTEKDVRESLDMVKTEVIRALIAAGTRIDGRDLFTVRPIDCRVNLLPRTHGSALFTRGETQALITVTLGSSADTQKVDGLREPYDEKFFVHYQAPGFSVGEARAPRGPSRRDIGHGMLAQRSLEPMMPHNEGFPYTVRAVSEVLEMNGSSSMATVCGSTLALMDAGVPIKKPVAGIAMGLLQNPGEEPVVITDILGDEDHYGDMDFKVCGTAEGITALQMDIKVKGISTETMKKALAQAKDGRLHILGKITDCITKPREEINPRAPRLHVISVSQDLLGKLIGPGGKTIRAIQEETGTKVDIEDNGDVHICAPDGDSLKACVQMVEMYTAQPELGKVYEGRVTSTRDFGAFVEILPGTDGMCHVSELDEGFVKSVDDICALGDILKVKVIGIDDQGKIRLSRKAVQMEERGEEYVIDPNAGRKREGGDRGRGGRGGDRGRGGRGDRGGSRGE